MSVFCFLSLQLSSVAFSSRPVSACEELAKQLPKSGKLERRWMQALHPSATESLGSKGIASRKHDARFVQDLRHIDDQRLDELHKILSKGFAEAWDQLEF